MNVLFSKTLLQTFRTRNNFIRRVSTNFRGVVWEGFLMNFIFCPSPKLCRRKGVFPVGYLQAASKLLVSLLLPFPWMDLVSTTVLLWMLFLLLFSKVGHNYIAGLPSMSLLWRAVLNAKKPDGRHRIQTGKIEHFHPWLQSAHHFQNIFDHLFVIYLELVSQSVTTVIQLPLILVTYRRKWFQIFVLFIVLFLDCFSKVLLMI